MIIFQLAFTLIAHWFKALHWYRKVVGPSPFETQFFQLLYFQLLKMTSFTDVIISSLIITYIHAQ